MAASKTKPTDRFALEKQWLDRGKSQVAGVDEAGRGPLAGPVVAAAVCLPPTWVRHGLPDELEGLNDSKKLSAKKRECFFTFLSKCAEVDFGIADVDAQEIDRINILQATHKAMKLAIGKLSEPPDHLLVDGRSVKGLPVPQTAIVKGDSLSFSIAAASVLAKVTRDRMMVEYDNLFPGYGFAVHKGYGTRRHIEAISSLGPCPTHRRSFAPIKSLEPDLFFRTRP